MKSFAVIGLGLFGTQLAEDLFNAGNNVLALDDSEEQIEAIADYVSRAAVVDAKNRDALSKLGLCKYDCVIVATASDLANSVLITMNLKALNVPQIVCKVQSETDREVLETLGASFCIIPESIAAVNLSKRLTSRNVIDFTQVSDDCGIVEMIVPSAWVGKSIIELGVRAKYGVNIIAKKKGDETQVNFDPAASLAEGEVLMIIGQNKALAKIEKVK